MLLYSATTIAAVIECAFSHSVPPSGTSPTGCGGILNTGNPPSPEQLLGLDLGDCLLVIRDYRGDESQSMLSPRSLNELERVWNKGSDTLPRRTPQEYGLQCLSTGLAAQSIAHSVVLMWLSKQPENTPDY